MTSTPGARSGGRRGRFLRIVCPSNHPLIEVVPGLDGPVLLLKGHTIDKARPAVRLIDLLGPQVAVRCRCDCSDHDVLAEWIKVKLGAGAGLVVWDGLRD